MPANHDIFPVFARAGYVQTMFGLSRGDLKKLRESGNVHAHKATKKLWLYRISDIVRYLESCEDGIVRDEAYYEDLAFVKAQEVSP